MQELGDTDDLADNADRATLPMALFRPGVADHHAFRPGRSPARAASQCFGAFTDGDMMGQLDRGIVGLIRVARH